MCLKYKSLLRKDEIALFEVYIAKDAQTGNETDDQRMRRVMEAYARDREGILKQQEQAGFAGASFGNQQGSKCTYGANGRGGNKRGRGNGGRRHGYVGGDSKQPGSGSGSKSCSKCGSTSCKSLSSGKASDCYYFKLKCNRCKVVGHKASCCPQGADKKHNNNAQACAAHEDENDQLGDFQGVEDNPPGFPRRQPRC